MRNITSTPQTIIARICTVALLAFLLTFSGFSLFGQTYLSEDFESAFSGTPAAPTGWTQTRISLLNVSTPNANGVDGPKDWQRNTWSGSAYSISSIAGGANPYPGAPVSGTGVLFLQDYFFGSTTTTLGSRRLESPAIDLSASTSPYVRFYFAHNIASTTTSIRIMASTDGGTTWNNIMPVNGNNSAAWQRISILVPTAYRTANVKFGIEMTNLWSLGDVFIDQFVVEEFTPGTIVSNGTGPWQTAATWVGGVVPSPSDNVQIAAGHVVSINSTGMTRCQNLTVDGTLQYSSTTTSELLHVFGDITVNLGGTLNSFSGTTGKRVYIGGSLLNNGTVNFSVGAGNIVWVSAQPATVSGSGSFSTFVSNSWHAKSGTLTYNAPIQIRNTVGVYDGQIDPNGNLTIGNAAVTTQTIERARGTFTSAPLFGTGVTRSHSYVDGIAGLTLVPNDRKTIITGEEIQSVSGVRTVGGTLSLNTHGNVQMSYPITVGTGTAGTLTLTRGILINNTTNVLTINNTTSAGVAGTTGSTAAIPTTHGAYVTGAVRINFPATGTASRSFPLGRGTAYNNPDAGPNSNILKTVVIAAGVTNWASQTPTVSFESTPGGTFTAPLQSFMGNSYGYRINRNGGPDFSNVATISIIANNYTNGGGTNSDNMPGTIPELYVAQSTALTGSTWTLRSASSGTGSFVANTNYTRVTGTGALAIGPLGTNGEYFTFASSASSCFPPTALVVNSFTTSSVNFSWTAPSPAPSNGYQWAVTTSATPPGSGTAEAGTSASQSGLTANTTHYIHVRSDCGSGVFSAWSTISFYTGYCVASIANSDPTGLTRVVFNTIDNTSLGDPAYVDYTAQSTTVQQGEPYSLSAYVNTDGSWTVNARAWIDWNQNMLFEASEMYILGSAFNTASGITSASPFSVVVPLGATLGTTRMRVVAIESSNPTPVACGSQLYGEVEDYTIIVTPAPTCPTPTTLGAGSITFISANLTWTSNASSSLFDIYYGVSPLAVPNGATTPTVNDYNGGAGASISYPLSGLSQSTIYQYYVREDCGAGDVSNWSGPFTFTTPTPPPANDNCAGAISLTPCAVPVQAIGLTGATESLPAPGDCGGNANDDVWYSFVANSTTMYITVQCFGGYDAVVEGRIGPGCNGTYLGCIDNTLDDEFEDVVLTGAIIGQTYYIRVYDWYSATLPPTAGFNIAVAPAGCWQGWNSTAWNDGGNWSNAVVPALCADNVIIPGGLTNYPVVNIVSATAGSVDIQSGASLTINTGNTLNVCGDFINYGTPNIGDGTLNFTSTANQGHIGNTVANFVSVNKTAGVVDVQDGGIDVNTAVQLQNGTLSTLLGGSVRLLSTSPTHAAIIDNFSPSFGGTLTGPITAQRFISGAGNVQHQMGLPVSANLGQLGAGASSGYVIPQPTCDETESASNSPYGNVFRWDESNPTTCILQGWNVMNSGTANESGRGYSTYQTGGNVIEVTGAPNLAGSYTQTGLTNSNYNLPTLQSSGSYTFNSGWHLLANPYPSGYTYTAQAGFGAVGSVYVPSGPYSGTYQPLNSGDQLAPFQGFMVFKTPGAPATYTHSGTNRVASGSQQFYQNSAAESLEIEVSGNTYRDKTLLRLDDASSNQYDAEYDLRKQRSNLGQPSIFTGHHSEPYRINVQPHTGTVPMGLIPGATGTFTVEVNGIQSFDPTSYIYLEDKVTGVWQNLRTNNSYTFSMNKTESVDRFVLHFTPKAEIATANATCTENGQLTITQPGQAQWMYAATNNTGVQVGSGMLNESNPINLSVPQGIYTITLTDANGYTVTKAVQVNGAQTTSAMFNSSKPVAEVEESISFTTTAASNAATLSWNMGDGTIHSGQATTINHQYSAEGVYTVTLNATSADGCSDVQTRTVTITSRAVTSVATHNAQLATVRMYPNPNSGSILQVELTNIETATLRITNAIGEVVYTSYIGKGQNTVQIGELPAGVYMAEVSNSKLRLTERLVVVK